MDIDIDIDNTIILCIHVNEDDRLPLAMPKNTENILVLSSFLAHITKKWPGVQGHLIYEGVTVTPENFKEILEKSTV